MSCIVEGTVFHAIEGTVGTPHKNIGGLARVTRTASVVFAIVLIPILTIHFWDSRKLGAQLIYLCSSRRVSTVYPKARRNELVL